MRDYEARLVQHPRMARLVRAAEEEVMADVEYLQDLDTAELEELLRRGLPPCDISWTVRESQCRRTVTARLSAWCPSCRRRHQAWSCSWHLRLVRLFTLRGRECGGHLRDVRAS